MEKWRRIKGWCTHPRFGGRYAGAWEVGVRIVTVGVGGATVGAGGDTKRISTLTGPKVSRTSHPHLTNIYMHNKHQAGTNTSHHMARKNLNYNLYFAISCANIKNISWTHMVV